METIDITTALTENIGVVEGLIGVATITKNGLLSKSGFFDKGTILSLNCSDINSITNAGCWRVNQSEAPISNSPFSAAYYSLITFSFMGGERLIQLAFNETGEGLVEKGRSYNGIKWSEWAPIL